MSPFLVEPEQASLAASTHPPRAFARPEWMARLVSALDLLLSTELRHSSAPELARHRVQAGACGFLLLFILAALVTFPLSKLSIIMVLMIVSYALALVWLRSGASPMASAMTLCLSTALGGLTIGFMMEGVPYAATHVAFMLPLTLAVYLMGIRKGFFITLLICLSNGLIYPLYHGRFQVAPHGGERVFFWPLYAVSITSFLGVWWVSSLHSAARDGVQLSLERALAVLSDSESKLHSLFESTNDLLASLDAQGRLITANSAAKKAWRLRFGAEIQAGQPFFPESAPALREAWEPRLAQVFSGQRQRFEEIHDHKGVRFTFDTSVNPIRDAAGRITGATIFARNITARKEAESRLGEMHRTLVDVSRQAGMAEIATGVLHNVGNTLNSVNVSTTLVIDQLVKSRLAGLGKACALLREHSGELGTFITQDPHGQQLPAYLSALFQQLQKEHDTMLEEMRSLSSSVEHIKAIVSMQQKHARTAGTLEEVPVPQLIDEALRLHTAAFGRLGIQLERNYANVPSIRVDRHRLLQIVVNLVNNARDSLAASEARDKRLRISVHLAPGSGHLRIQVSDNGLGIASEHLSRMFTQGFTTKKEGHGFGLHISALAAMEMKGKLTCTSPGRGFGATFTLELPPRAAEA